MTQAKLISIFFIFPYGILGYASTDIHYPETLPTKVPTLHALELSNQRSPKLLQPSQNIYTTKNFIKSKLPQNNGQPQLFNLGYSVRFENQQNQNQEIAFEKPQRTNIQQGDIITGTRKQNVEIDLPGSSNEDAQFGLKQDSKKRKTFGSNASASQHSENIILENAGQSYISATTQKSLEALGRIKDVDYQQDLSDLYQQKYTWRNLSPNVKIIRSTEIPIERIENRALNFDHEKALSKSEGFGFSDAIKDENFETNHFAQKENAYDRVKVIPSTPKPEKFRVIHVQEQINEPPIKHQVLANPDLYTLNTNTEHENIFQKLNQEPQIQQQIKTVKISPTTILQAVDGTPLKSKIQSELIKPQIPKQAYIQHIVVPQIQFESTPKYRNKQKFVKHIAGTRGNVIYARKVPASLDYTRKAKIRPELRREFKPPPLGSRI
ncbi:uncharacterized protein LOC123685113 [Harmonia axyridis]|uniref:uncharacterized protein LOC123685113 n=1 Tax=Harmonia axyridis TaxID=115357 RepID=UPI001E2795AE|nr:uncharacterized protein LOC123685113 [Harmonia axyridis]